MTLHSDRYLVVAARTIEADMPDPLQIAVGH